MRWVQSGRRNLRNTCETFRFEFIEITKWCCQRCLGFARLVPVSRALLLHDQVHHLTRSRARRWLAGQTWHAALHVWRAAVVAEARELAVWAKERQHRRTEAATRRKHLHALTIGIVAVSETISTERRRLAHARLLLVLLGLLAALLVGLVGGTFLGAAKIHRILGVLRMQHERRVSLALRVLLDHAQRLEEALRSVSACVGKRRMLSELLQR